MSTPAAGLLLVEPHAADAELATRLLARAGWSEIVTAPDGASALARLHGPGGHPHPPLPRLVLLAPKLPGLDAFSVLEQIRAHPRTRLLPVVVFGSLADGSEAARSYAAGANGVVARPVDFDELAVVIRRVTDYWLETNQPAH